MEVTYDVCLCVFVVMFIYVSVCTFVYLCRGHRSRSNVLFSSVFAYLYFESGPSHLDMLAAHEPQQSSGVQLPSVMGRGQEDGVKPDFIYKSWRGDLRFSCLTTAPTLQSMTDIFMVFLVHDLSCLTVHLSCLQASL